MSIIFKDDCLAGRANLVLDDIQASWFQESDSQESFEDPLHTQDIVAEDDIVVHLNTANWSRLLTNC